MGTIEARFLGRTEASHWLHHTPVQIFFRFILVHKKVYCSLSSLCIQTRVLAVTFCITLLSTLFFLIFQHNNTIIFKRYSIVMKFYIQKIYLRT